MLPDHHEPRVIGQLDGACRRGGGLDRGLPTAALGPNHSQSLFARRGMKADRDSAPRAACRCGAVCSGRRGPSRLPGPSAGACSSLAGSESRVRAAGGPPESRRRAGPPWYPNRSGDCHAAIKAPASEAPVLNVRGLRNLPVGLGTGTIRDFRVTSQQFKKKIFLFSRALWVHDSRKDTTTSNVPCRRARVAAARRRRRRPGGNLHRVT